MNAYGNQLDLFEARAARDEGIDRVLDNAPDDWKARVWAFVASLPRGIEMTAEEIRIEAEARCGFPHHHNAWGGLIAGLVKAGMLVDTGWSRPMRTVRSHARKTTIWRRT